MSARRIDLTCRLLTSSKIFANTHLKKEHYVEEYCDVATILDHLIHETLIHDFLGRFW